MMMMSTHFLFFTISPRSIRQRHWKQRANDVDSLFVVCILHGVAEMNPVATPGAKNRVDTLFVCRSPHEVTEKTPKMTRELESSVYTLFVVVPRQGRVYRRHSFALVCCQYLWRPREEQEERRVCRRYCLIPVLLVESFLATS